MHHLRTKHQHAALNTLRALTAAVSIVLFAFVPHVAAQDIKVGILAYLGAEHSLDEWAATVHTLKVALPRSRVEVRPLDHAGLSHALAQNEIDFVLTNPGHYVELEVAYGISRIATRQTGMPVASTIVVRSDRADLKSLRDLRGKSVAIVTTEAFGGFQVAWRELALAGIDPGKDLSLVAVGLPMTQVLSAVVSNRVDAGIVRGCLIEQRERSGDLARGAIRVLSPIPNEGTGCVVSSRLYPDWPIAKARRTSPELAKRVATALLTFEPPPGEPSWTVPVDYQPVHDLFRDLMIGPYESLRHVSLSEQLRRHWYWVVLALLSLLAWVAHVLRVEGLVRRRTRELAVANTDLTREITARKAAEERDALHRRELDHVGRLSIVGEMAGGLAHELNQPLAAIANYADGCQIRLQQGQIDGPALIDATGRIRQQAERAGQIIKRMRAFVRKREPIRTPVEPSEVIAETVELFEGPARRAGVQLNIKLGSALPLVNADRIQLQQVLLNLLQNALDALRDAPAGDKAIDVDLSARDLGVAISVIDNGLGISSDVAPRLFEPFFTTKPEGLGLGLALCRSIVEEHGGRLSAHDNPGGGTIMRVWLPAIKAETPRV